MAKKTMTLIKKDNKLTPEEEALKEQLIEADNKYNSFIKVIDELQKNKKSFMEISESVLDTALSLYLIKVNTILMNYMEIDIKEIYDDIESEEEEDE